MQGNTATPENEIMPHLIWFRSHNRYDSCKITELESLAEIFGQDLSTLWKWETEHILSKEENKERSKAKELKKRNEQYLGDMFVKGHFKNDDICKNIISRSILAKGIIEIWAEGISYDDILQQLLNKTHLFEKYLKNKKWSFRFASVRKVISQEERVKKMNYFQMFFKNYNAVDIINPDVQIALFEEFDKKDTSVLKKVYFGRCIALRSDSSLSAHFICNKTHGAKETKKEQEVNKYTRKAWWNAFTLTSRPVLAPTTIDNELAFIMCNIAKVKKGSIVLDPFVGSGGLLISCTIFNAICIGNDIDIRLLQGQRLSYLNKHMTHVHTGKNIFQNFFYYNLIKPDIVRSDISNPVWHFLRGPWVDIILTDPPYGNRAAIRTSVKKEVNDELGLGNADNANNVKLVYNSNSVTKKTHGYDCDAAIRDLFTIASNVLVDNGMLVFLYPITLGTAKESLFFLKHPDFYLKSYDLQTLTSTTGRLIISMQRKERK